METTQTKQAQQTTEPVLPHIKCNTDSIQLNGKTHKLPITKEYILKEYHDVFKGVGTLPGGPYHIRLKEQYRPVQHPPRSVPVAMQTTYKAELERPNKVIWLLMTFTIKSTDYVICAVSPSWNTKHFTRMPFCSIWAIKALHNEWLSSCQKKMPIPQTSALSISRT